MVSLRHGTSYPSWSHDMMRPSSFLVFFVLRDRNFECLFVVSDGGEFRISVEKREGGGLLLCVVPRWGTRGGGSLTSSIS